MTRSAENDCSVVNPLLKACFGLAWALDADRRATEVIQRLRLLFTKGQVVQQQLAPAEVVREVLRLLWTDLRDHGVAARESIAKDLPDILGDRVQLQPVLINVIMNACDAMTAAAQAEPLVTVRVERTPDGTGVRISITDNGQGIAADRLEQVFEPFFTTKATGMGLGLAVCRTIVTAHGGRLWAEHVEGGGTTFFLDLRAVEGEDAASASLARRLELFS